MAPGCTVSMCHTHTPIHATHNYSAETKVTHHVILIATETTAIKQLLSYSKMQ